MSGESGGISADPLSPLGISVGQLSRMTSDKRSTPDFAGLLLNRDSLTYHHFVMARESVGPRMASERRKDLRRQTLPRQLGGQAPKKE